MGARLPPRDRGCAVTYDYGDMSKVLSMMTSGYVQVGSATVVNAGDSWSDTTRSEVQLKVCEFGGDTAVIASSSPDSNGPSGSGVISVVILRRGEAPPEAPGPRAQAL